MSRYPSVYGHEGLRFAEGRSPWAPYLFSDILQCLFFSLSDHTGVQVPGDLNANFNTNHLKLLKFTKDFGRSKYDLTQANTPSTRFAAFFDPGDEYPERTPALGIRLDQVFSSSRSRSYRNRHRSDLVAEVLFPIHDIKAISVKRLGESDFANLEGAGYSYFNQDDPQDYMYEVSIHISRFGHSNNPPPFSSRQFLTGPYYRQYESSGRNLKDMYKHAESIKFIITAPCETWTKLRRLQREHGLCEEAGNSSSTVFFSVNNMENSGAFERDGGTASYHYTSPSRLARPGRLRWELGRRSPSPGLDVDDDRRFLYGPGLRAARNTTGYNHRYNRDYY
ncbi:hypothetical protein H072_11542 [Dactylellina haptotyla CBS 200.50]|uniref:Uncharacterized protein n=1 Tax=Dactylellina haptotyla (strain CBS 200.50) TaxID=1284197 RepID=S8B7X2_DACHA|nr:hypothetical protein H072_11542 [Dactylellina haptotyla CBS 200.50]